MKSAPPEEGGCNAAFPLLCECLLSFSGRTLIFWASSFFYSGLFTVYFLCDNITEGGAENSYYNTADWRKEYGLWIISLHFWRESYLLYRRVCCRCCRYIFPILQDKAKTRPEKGLRWYLRLLLLWWALRSYSQRSDFFLERLGGCFPNIKQS